MCAECLYVNVSGDPSQVLEIENGEFAWSKDAQSPTLEGINYVARKGELTGIIGRVGAGKVRVLMTS